MVKLADVPERLLEQTVRDDRELRALRGVLLEEAVGDVGEELRTLLHRIQTARPEEERRVGILLQPKRMLQGELIPALRLAVVVRTVLERNLVVNRRIVSRVRGVQDARRTARVGLITDLITDRIGDE